MSAYTIARGALDDAMKSAAKEGFAPADVAHALLVTLVETYKELRGMDDTRDALQFQLDNLRDDLDYEFMRP